MLSAVVLYNTFRLVALIAEIATRTFLSQTCHDGRLRNLLLTVSRPQGYTLEDIYEDAINQLRACKDAGHLSPADYESLMKTEKPEDILDTLQEAIEKNVALHTDTKRRAQSVLEPLLLRLERFSSTIDILSQPPSYRIKPRWAHMGFCEILTRSEQVAEHILMGNH